MKNPIRDVLSGTSHVRKNTLAENISLTAQPKQWQLTVIPNRNFNTAPSPQLTRHPVYNGGLRQECFLI